MKIVIQLLLWVVIGFLGYFTFNAVYEPIQFNKVRDARYPKVIEKLKDIRKAELAHKQVTGTFSGDWDGLVRFIDTAEFVVTQRRDTTVLDEEYKATYGVDEYKSITLVDTLGYTPVKDSLFKGSNRYTTMMNVPFTDGQKFELDAGEITKNDSKIPVFEVKVDKADILSDQDEHLVNQEKQVLSVDNVRGEYIQVGSMTEVNTNGNWPKVYGSNDD
ncbi:hypothetical protein [Mesonia aestuariivivens]|uniref:LPS export ABC transporter periplasmic protein LptC n=1 Tax=Mesonia aestuariivivens TaxID=2796128 RepID=A0ABS6VYH6_9FLAO|nr:hypothetical protein [Mesonia aestuariivivens]MBW2960637.1 hypothetical protein [Mesonia aestuariivivens]